MKKLLIVSLKSILFFVGWAICVSLIPIPDVKSGVVWRFFAELIPFLVISVLTFVFWWTEKRKTQLHLINNPSHSSILGIITGLIWLSSSAGILLLTRSVHIEGNNHISMLWLWILSAFINTVMQEMLVRGYLYQMIKKEYNLAAAVIVSTLLFTFAHGGAFEAGLLPVLNVLTMSLFMTAVLEYTDSLIAPIIIHFLWNSIGAIILGGVSLAEDYPHVLNMTFDGNMILSGGIYKIEGSIVVLILNLIMIAFFTVSQKRTTHTSQL